MITIEQIRIKLIEAIKQSGMTQTELAKQIGVCHQAIGQYLYQNKMPALDTFANLCVVLDIDPADILCTNAPNPSSPVRIGNGNNIHIGHNFNISGGNNNIK